MVRLGMTRARDRETELIERLRCPQCGGGLRYQPEAGDAAACCVGCAVCYPRREGVWHMLTPAQEQQYQPFLDGYTRLRDREGWARSPAYYLGLPAVPRRDPAAAMWRIRRRSWRQTVALLGPGAGRWLLDLGAGNGWVARRLTQRGFVAVASDLQATGIEGLAGGQIFLDHDRSWFGRVQATMDALPFAPATFAVCVISGSLYYADLERTIQGMWEVLEPGGLLLISDSPVYRQAAAGAAMADELRTRTRALLGMAPVALPGGAGFLVESHLLAVLRRVGFRPRVISTERWLGRVRRRLRRLMRPGAREQARFPVVAAWKPPGPNAEGGGRSVE